MNNPYHRCGEICCRCWRTNLLLIALALVVGCAPLKPAVKPTPVPVVAVPMPPDAVVAKAMQSRSVVAPPKTNGVIGLRYGAPPDASVVGYCIYETNGTLKLSVKNFDNCVLRGYAPGQAVAFYATSVNAAGVESEPSNIAICTASTSISVTPYERAYARSFSWPCANGVTNVLQSSAYLTTWATASRFRGTNGTAVVTLTNQTAFHRVLVHNATNVSPMTLTQQTAFVMLVWNTTNTTALLEREAYAATGSFVTVQTNLSPSGSAVLPFAAGAKYQVASQ